MSFCPFIINTVFESHSHIFLWWTQSHCIELLFTDNSIIQCSWRLYQVKTRTYYFVYRPTRVIWPWEKTFPKVGSAFLWNHSLVFYMPKMEKKHPSELGICKSLIRRETFPLFSFIFALTFFIYNHPQIFSLKFPFNNKIYFSCLSLKGCGNLATLCPG